MNVALILSGGVGTRLGADIPKQYLEVGGRPIISFCIETLSQSEWIDAIQIVAEDEWQAQIEEWLPFYDKKKKFQGFSLPGENRQFSILHGLEDMLAYTGRDDMVLIHDAARPLLSGTQIQACFEAAKGHDGVMPVLPMKDTVYYSRDGAVVSKLLEREKIFAGQAPELFSVEKYYEANQLLPADVLKQICGSTEPAIMAGLDIVMIPGEETNFKITTRTDLDNFKKIMDDRAEEIGV